MTTEIMTRAMATAVAVAIAAVLVVLVVRADQAFQRDCRTKGGHTVSHTEVGTGFTSTGKPVTTTSTTTFCLSADGRILDIH